ncbi:hypothetical protein ONZ45_g4005 [Pleurotus djamor]|nr:hypothetical protein ONZ45_g4005 [Pleurotus djamor]
MAPMPPYATDIPDNEYDKPAQTRRLRQKPENPNARSSAYDMYDNYLAPGSDPAASRNSGVGALGLGLMNGDMSDSDDEEEDTPRPKPQAAAPNKQAALLAATTTSQAPPSRAIDAKSPPPIAAPRPGYPAPIAALNLARPAPAASPQQQQHGNPFSDPQNPFKSPQSSPVASSFPPSQPQPRQPAPPGIRIPNIPVPGTPVPSAPFSLQAPMTPITPAFVRPTAAGARDVKFSEPIMRSEKEETLLPKRGERGDDFWRRFSMIAKDETQKTESSWLKKTQSGTSRLSTWVYVIGILLLILIAGGIGIGVYASQGSNSGDPPTAIGGSANQAGDTSVVGTKQGGPTVRSSILVQPTRTLDDRDVSPAAETGVAAIRRHLKRRRGDVSVMMF